MSLFQIIALLLLVWFGYKQFVKFKGMPAIKVVFQLRWFIMTLLAVLFVSEPTVSSTVAEKLGIKRGVDVVVYFALLWLLYHSYNQSQEIDRLHEKLDKLVRTLALQSHKTGFPAKKERERE